MQEYDITITVMATDDAAVAEIRDLYTGELRSVGTSKRHPNDAPNETIGVNLAVGRALIEYGIHAIEHAACENHFVIN